MKTNRTEELAATLAKTDAHKTWEACYRSQDNEKFYEEAFDYIVEVLKPPDNTLILDAGCGTGAHSIRLAMRGVSVLGIDFSDSVLREARNKIRARKLEHKISFQHENILSLSFAPNSFSYVLCWGVLMHIQDVEKAITEFARVLEPGGWLILSEGNMYSLQSVLSRALMRLLRKEVAVQERNEAGLECWKETCAGTLLTRQAEIGGLTNIFRRNGFILKKRIAGQFTEVYTRFSSPNIRKTVHELNHLWFRYVKVPEPAFGNILFFEKSTE